jgi:hypothetical protein
MEEISGRAELLSGRQQNAEIEGHVNVVVCIVGAIIGVSKHNLKRSEEDLLDAYVELKFWRSPNM